MWLSNNRSSLKLKLGLNYSQYISVLLLLIVCTNAFSSSQKKHRVMISIDNKESIFTPHFASAALKISKHKNIIEIPYKKKFNKNDVDLVIYFRKISENTHEYLIGITLYFVDKKDEITIPEDCPKTYPQECLNFLHDTVDELYKKLNGKL